MDTVVASRTVPFFAGRYRCESYLGGGMADVYRASDTELPREVAIKILKPANQNDHDIRAAFLDEVQIASRCAHENIVMTYDKGEIDGSPYIVMEFLRGASLKKVIESGQQGSLKQILNIALQTARALEYVHLQNIIHRDLKPDNLNVDLNGRVKLVDFGIAKSVGLDRTQVGLVKGTPHYMSPEQILGENVAFQTDIWSFGVVMFEMLSGGKRPFQGATIDILWASIVNATPDYAGMGENGTPESVQKIVRHCLEKNPENRYATFAEVATDIEAELTAMLTKTLTAIPAIPNATKWTSKPTVWMGGGAMALLLVGIGVFIHSLSTPKAVPTTPIARELVGVKGGDMELVAAGPALLGSDKHKANLKAFYIDKTEVSNGAYAQFIAEQGLDKPSDFPADKPDLPVVNVTIRDALAFASWAGKRLPTSQEWEKAARGTDGQNFPWGNDLNPRMANVFDNATLAKHEIMPVTAFPQGKSPFGALNMCGNVWEWVLTPQKPDADTFANIQKQLHKKLSPNEKFYMIRGGDIYTRLSGQLMADAAPFPASLGNFNIGFRCAKDAEIR